MARVLLVNPPFYRLLGSHYNGCPLGISYIAAVLNEAGHDAWLYNADFVASDRYGNFSSLMKEFSSYIQYFRNSNSIIWNTTAEDILAFDPDWVGYTCYTANIRAIDIISQKVKVGKPSVQQVVGGVHPTLDLSILKQLSSIDYAVVGDGEYAMLRLVDGEVPSTVLYSPIAVSDIDALPLPERDKLWHTLDRQKNIADVSHVISGRGCPYECTYCASSTLCKRHVRYRDPSLVIDELQYVKDNYWDECDCLNDVSKLLPENGLCIRDNSVVYFVDDVFTLPKRRAISMLTQMVDRKLCMPWKCEARADHLDSDICALMVEAGCIRVKVGFESGSERILTQVKKGETKDDMRRGAALLKEFGIPFTAYFMTGFPGETDADLRETIAFAKELEADFYSLSVLAPYYGTPMYYELIAQGTDLGKLPWEYFYHQVGDPIVNSNLSKEVIDEFLALSEKGYI